MITGKQLAEARVRANLTQTELAAILNTTQRTISSWENSQVPSKREPAVAVALGEHLVSPSEDAWLDDQASAFTEESHIASGSNREGPYVRGVHVSRRANGKSSTLRVVHWPGHDRDLVPAPIFAEILDEMSRRLNSAARELPETEGDQRWPAAGSSEDDRRGVAEAEATPIGTDHERQAPAPHRRQP